ncbi:phage tail sheath C-terminal domain-containing protein [Pluralibacter sp.]|uniref:phage tail sheath family protein n=1 Tax=Pluralibacter sp. TaxID=1920032 RepID=UPI0025F58C9D|nr:phage tail sheath C-terminal domain-containing protein [Pluralibacter sp.]MBV8042107.1 phage tail sheath family protein [Pluralibacter sp.]
MPVITTYPGVYIEELASTALSVSGSSTAVPVFAIANTDAVFPNTPTRINSWLEYVSHLGSVGFDSKSNRDVAIRTYFENGGGYCYLVKADKLVTEVPALDDATLLVAAGENIQAAVTTLCVTGNNLFAILDGPEDEDLASDWAALYNETEYAAIYYPWLKADWTAVDVIIPPSAAVAGAYCLNDRSRGVWKAPANMALQGGVLPLFKVSDSFQGDHTTEGYALNMIRQFNNGSPLIWGARTSTAADDEEWRYVPVRRLFNSAEKDIKDTMQTLMYEPNSQPTWERARSAISNYLFGLWKQGGLAGAREEEAYFVKIGLNVTMTPDDINDGKMIVQVGMAAVRPAEFIILQFTQDVAQ